MGVRLPYPDTTTFIIYVNLGRMVRENSPAFFLKFKIQLYMIFTRLQFACTIVWAIMAITCFVAAFFNPFHVFTTVASIVLCLTTIKLWKNG